MSAGEARGLPPVLRESHKTAKKKTTPEQCKAGDRQTTWTRISPPSSPRGKENLGAQYTGGSGEDVKKSSRMAKKNGPVRGNDD